MKLLNKAGITEMIEKIKNYCKKSFFTRVKSAEIKITETERIEYEDICNYEKNRRCFTN